MSSRKVTLDQLISHLHQECSSAYQDASGIEWEWNHYLKLSEIIQQIKEKEAARDSTNDDPNQPNDIKRRKANLPAFLAWLKENGIDFEKVEIVPTKSTESKEKFDGFGLRTKVALQTDEIAFKIPEKVLMTTKNARESKFEILRSKEPILKTMDNVLLAVFLLYEKYITREKSFWKAYIDILPKTYDTILYFEPKEMKLLRENPFAFRESLKMYRSIARQYAYFHGVFRESTDSASRALRTIFTYNRYVWAVSSIITRQNKIPRPLNGPGRHDLSLVPLWDMCNHDENTQISTDYNDEEQTLVCYASQDYEAGVEFKIFYGHRTSMDFFIHGGFVPQSHADDVYNLELGISKNDINFMRKKTVLMNLRLQHQSAFEIKPERLPFFKSLFVFLRVFHADKDFLDKIESDQPNGEDLEYLSVPNEQTWSFLATRFSLLKRSSENNLAKVVKMVSEESSNSSEKQLSAKQLMVLQLFKNEKKFLDLLATLCTENLNQLKKLE